jgi:hypothetical protein
MFFTLSFTFTSVFPVFVTLPQALPVCQWRKWCIPLLTFPVFSGKTEQIDLLHLTFPEAVFSLADFTSFCQHFHRHFPLSFY